MTNAGASTICWPARFLAKWFAVFFAAIMIGAVIAVLSYHKPVAAVVSISNVSASVRVFIYYGSESQGVETAADVDVYQNGKKLGTFTAPNPKSFGGGSKLRMLIRPRDGGSSGEQEITWPETASPGLEVVLRVPRTVSERKSVRSPGTGRTSR